MNHLKQWLIAMLSVLALVIVSTVPAQASVGNYGIKPNYGKNQSAQNGQVDIFGNPGSQQDISIAVANKDTKSHRYTVTVNTAGTGTDGTYSYNKDYTDPSMNIKLSKYVKPRVQTITVPAGQVVDVHFQVHVPKQKFPGYLMGGILVRPAKGEKAVKTVAKNGSLLTNKFAQGVPLRVRQKEDAVMHPKFRALKVTPYALSAGKGQRGVNADIQNYVKGFDTGIKAKATVTKKPNDHKFKKTSTLTAMSPAPNSNFNYAIDWGDTPLQAGNYHLHVKLVSSDKTKSWIVDKDFTITSADAGKYNKLSGIKPNYMWLWILIAVLVILLVLGLGIYFGRRNNNKNNN